MTRLRRYPDNNRPVFVTLVTYRRFPWLRCTDARRTLIRTFRGVKALHPFRNYGHVLLDDHIHWLFQPPEGTKSSLIVGAVKQAITRELRPRLGLRGLWQDRFHDHIIRDGEDFARHLDYIHFNPVKHGYVRMPCQYRWSSFHAWVARGVYLKSWGANEPETLAGLELD